MSNTASCPCPPKQVAIIPVSKSTACFDPCAAQNEATAACDPRQAPFFTQVVSASVAMPLVGSEVLVEVCDTSLWAVGQWVQTPLGKLKITEVTSSSLRLLNGCPGPTAISGNSSPGTISTGPFNIWLTDFDCTVEDICDEVNTCLEAATELCLPNLPDIGNGNFGHLWAGTEEDPCGEDSTSCVRRVPGATTDGNQICFATPSENETDTFFPAVYEAADVCDDNGFCLKKRAAEANPGLDIWCAGSQSFLQTPNDFSDVGYKLGVNPVTGCVKFVEDRKEVQFAWTSRVDTMAAGNYTFDFATEAPLQGVTLPTGPYKARVTVHILDSSSSDIQLVLTNDQGETRQTMPIGSGVGSESGVYVFEMSVSDDDTVDYTINKGGGSSAISYLTFSALLPACE